VIVCDFNLVGIGRRIEMKICTENVFVCNHANLITLTMSCSINMEQNNLTEKKISNVCLGIIIQFPSSDRQ